ncbi:IclR family transcriptional regulator [Burkholderia stagnalis]
MDKDSVSVVKSADRVLDVLELLAARRRPMSHTEIGEALSIPKSSLTQLLRNLEARGYLALVPGPNTYDLGPALFALVREAGSEPDLIKLIRPFVERLTAELNESSAFNLLRENGVECVSSMNSSHALLFIMRTGEIAPLHAVSSGKAILAFLPEDEREQILGRMSFERVTEHTKTSVDGLRKELLKIARDGVAYSFEEYTRGIVGIAVPVLDAQRRPLGAINIAVPVVRYSPSRDPELVDALVATATAIEAELSASAGHHKAI